MLSSSLTVLEIRLSGFFFGSFLTIFFLYLILDILFFLISFILFIFISKFLDFFLGISVLSILVSYFWGEKRLIYLIIVGIIFPIIVFIFFETILGLRFPSGIITNLYYG